MDNHDYDRDFLKDIMPDALTYLSEREGISPEQIEQLEKIVALRMNDPEVQKSLADLSRLAEFVQTLNDHGLKFKFSTAGESQPATHHVEVGPFIWSNLEAVIVKEYPEAAGVLLDLLNQG